MKQTEEMNFNHLQCCKCFQCRPPCRPRYSKEEWDDLDSGDKNKRCRHCGQHGSGYHAGSHWEADGVTAAGSCKADRLRERGIRPKIFATGTMGNSTAMLYSSNYVFDPL